MVGQSLYVKKSWHCVQSQKDNLYNAENQQQNDINTKGSDMKTYTTFILKKSAPLHRIALPTYTYPAWKLTFQRHICFNDMLFQGWFCSTQTGSTYSVFTTKDIIINSLVLALSPVQHWALQKSRPCQCFGGILHHFFLLDDILLVLLLSILKTCLGQLLLYSFIIGPISVTLKTPTPSFILWLPILTTSWNQVSGHCGLILAATILFGFDLAWRQCSHFWTIQKSG